MIGPPYLQGVTNPTEGVLRIVGLPVFNGMSIQCVAFVLIMNGETSPKTNHTSPVLLTVHKGCFSFNGCIVIILNTS